MFSSIHHQKNKQSRSEKKKTPEKLDFIKVKSFSASKDTVEKVKTTHGMGEKYLQVIYMIRSLNPKYIKNS
jgi:hypothetical protein